VRPSDETQILSFFFFGGADRKKDREFSFLLLSYALTLTSPKGRGRLPPNLGTRGKLSYIDNQIEIENKSGLLFAPK